MVIVAENTNSIDFSAQMNFAGQGMRSHVYLCTNNGLRTATALFCDNKKNMTTTQILVECGQIFAQLVIFDRYIFDSVCGHITIATQQSTQMPRFIEPSRSQIFWN